MMGINRSVLTRHSLLIILIFLGTPIVGRCDSLEDSARELAQKVAAALTSTGEFSCDIRNQSSLELDDIVRIKEAFGSKLPGQCVRTQANGSEAANIIVTLSESARTLVWTAEIHQAAAYKEVIQLVQWSSVSLKSGKTLPVVLRTEQFWEGPERILDADYMNDSNGDSFLILLLRDAMLARNLKNDSTTRIEVPDFVQASSLREPTGSVSEMVGHTIPVNYERRNCTISLDTHMLVKCEDYQGERYGQGGPQVKGGQVVGIATKCTKGQGMEWIVTGIGDDTQPDYLQVMVSQNLGSANASNPITFPGPILAIQNASGNIPRIIIKNLRTGNYEAYRLYISCAP